MSHEFDDVLNAEPDAIARAHGRANLIGEHIDYHGGMVMPMGLPQFCDVAVKLCPSAENDWMYAEGFGNPVDRPHHDPARQHWSDYVVGAVQFARRKGLFGGGVRVVTRSTVPHGAGVSSSAAVTVATLKALYTACGHGAPNDQVALDAQQVEHDYIGMPCGIMDQMAVAIAGPGEALLLDTKGLSYSLLKLPRDYHFAVVHSGVTRRLEDGRYAERRLESERARDAMGVEDLATLENAHAHIARLTDPVLARRARHVVTEHRRVLAAARALKFGDMPGVAKLITESHRSMRGDFEMSTPEIDALVDAAVAQGALAARLTGGGFGGCIVACVPRTISDQWFSRLKADFPACTLVA